MIDFCFFFPGELNLPMSDEQFLIKSDELYKQAFPSAELLPGAERLIQHLAAHNIPMGNNQELFQSYFEF
jgi:hypothetical protein